MYDSIIFDLDGTLWDVSEACSKGWNVALKGFQKSDDHVSADDIRSVSGLPFDECVSSLLGKRKDLDFRELGRLIDREERKAITLLGGDLYEEVREGIPELSEKYSLFLVSNCQDWYLESFWDIHGLKTYFKAFDCHGSSGVEKSKMISRVCEDNELTRPIYIGDTIGDQDSSRKAGVAYGHVAYGFGEVSGADHVFSSFGELVTWFIGNSKSPNKQGQQTPAA